MPHVLQVGVMEKVFSQGDDDDDIPACVTHYKAMAGKTCGRIIADLPGGGALVKALLKHDKGVRHKLVYFAMALTSKCALEDHSYAKLIANHKVRYQVLGERWKSIVVQDGGILWHRCGVHHFCLEQDEEGADFATKDEKGTHFTHMIHKLLCLVFPVVHL